MLEAGSEGSWLVVVELSEAEDELVVVAAVAAVDVEVGADVVDPSSLVGTVVAVASEG